MKKKMSFEVASRIVLMLVLAALVICVASMLFTTETDPVRGTLSVLAIACIIAALMFALTYCRCPSCGKVILVGMVKAKNCPHCHRSLATGAKVKGTKKR